MTWLITGGAGYIGAHVARAMAGAGERVVALDDLSAGVPARLPAEVPLVRGSSLDGELLRKVLAEHAVTGVVHLAARKQVAESVAQPTRYYRENVGGLATLLDAVADAGIGRFLFSSSAAVYGNPDVGLITEDTPCAPVNPYGETKLAGEWLVRAAGQAHGIATVCLRYFNVAGAASPELADTGVFNIVPMVFDRLTRDEAPRIFGDDYPTPDGTCIRDYIHVADLAEAHLAAAGRLSGPGAAGDLTLNIGRGEGVSVREMVDVIGEVTGDRRPPVVEARRPGDAPVSVAAAERAARELG
ncbi:MAG: UDP-glucose 4-epimerase GalE, partial [Streptomyces sp.]|nr:UDP-glucose 4-epimerase GalE [Streptomyces sp.]